MSDNMENSDTTHCFLDGSPKQMGFFDRSHVNKIDWGTFDVNPKKNWLDETEVIIIRPVLFFRKEQKITLGKLREFFTEKAIKLFETDDYIKINISE